jgi:outer membrane protein OmpA-like peptidoglycan-associated protein
MSSNIDTLTESVEKTQDTFLSNNGQNDFEELRRLIVQPAEVGEVLPTALSQKSKTDGKLAEATLPIVEENIRQSVKRKPEILAEALSPIIGPAIRKAIAEALGAMVQSLNQTLEYSLSPKSLRWRLEAMRTGKTFAEVVILKTLLFRVEQAFLIHEETGGLLLQVSADKNISEDADMVSAMLTAIQDFVRDSFKNSQNATLDSFQADDLSVWIERSSDLVLAAVIRGNAPLTLRETLEDVVERIQFEHIAEFENFDGNTDRFLPSEPTLAECLQFQVGETEKKKTIFTPFNLVVGALSLLLLIGGFFYIRDYWRWSNYVSRLKNEQGIIVTEANRGWFTHSISGLRDNLAVQPASLLKDYSYDETDVEQNWKPFQDLSPELILQRAKKTLNPPETIKLSIENGILIADGNADNEWFSEAKKLSTAISGINEFRLSENALKTKIESNKILFTCATTDYLPNQAEKINEISKDLENLPNNFKVEIQGHASTEGSIEANSKISQARADKVNSEILSKSDKLKSSQSIKAISIGTKENNSECKVTFKILSP